MKTFEAVKDRIEQLERKQFPLLIRVFWLNENGVVNPGNTTEQKVTELAEEEGWIPVFLSWSGEKLQNLNGSNHHSENDVSVQFLPGGDSYED